MDARQPDPHRDRRGAGRSPDGPLRAHAQGTHAHRGRGHRSGPALRPLLHRGHPHPRPALRAGPERGQARSGRAAWRVRLPIPGPRRGDARRPRPPADRPAGSSHDEPSPAQRGAVVSTLRGRNGPLGPDRGRDRAEAERRGRAERRRTRVPAPGLGARRGESLRPAVGRAGGIGARPAGVAGRSAWSGHGRNRGFVTPLAREGSQRSHPRLDCGRSLARPLAADRHDERRRPDRPDDHPAPERNPDPRDL